MKTLFQKTTMLATICLLFSVSGFAVKRLNPVYISDNQNLTISMVMI